MNNKVLLALVVIPVAGCATPFDDPWDPSGPPPGNSAPLPLWITSEWRDAYERAGVSGNARPEHSELSTQDPDHRIGDTSTLDDLIAWALEHNPAVQAAEARWHAARHRIPQVQTLPEPELSYRILVEQIDRGRDPIGHVVGLSQMFPWFGTLELAGEVAAAEHRAAGRAYLARQLETAAAIRDAWAEYGYLADSESILRGHLDLLGQMEQVVRLLFQNNQVSQRDLLRVQQQIDRIENEVRDLEDLRFAAAARLNAAIGRRAEAALPAHAIIPDHPIELDEPKLMALIEEANPELDMLRHRIAARRKAVQLAGKRFYPDFMLGIEYGVNTGARMAAMERMAGISGGGTDMLGAMVSVRLPVWRDSYEHGRLEALAEWGEQLRMYTDRHNMLESELKMTLFRVREAERRRILYGDTLRIRAQQVLNTTFAGYRAGDAAFIDLIEAQRELLEFELAHRRSLADRFQQLAKVEQIVGRSFDPPGSGAAPVAAEGDAR